MTVSGRRVHGLYLGLMMGMPTLAGAAEAVSDSAGREASAKALFMQATVPACATCHTLKEVGSTGSVGPILDDIKPDAQRVAAAVRDGVGGMPAFRDQLSASQINALARYVAQASGGRP